MTLYDLLELPQTATLQEIKTAYKRLAKRYHPDINKQGADTFVKINNAYAVLSDTTQKAEYDAMLRFSEFEDRVKRLDLSIKWHEQFMEELQFHHNWDFDFIRNREYTQPTPTNNKYSSFLDKDVSLAFYQLYSKGKLDFDLEDTLLRRHSIKQAFLKGKKLNDVLKEQYNYLGWLEAKRYFNIDVEIELTPKEVREGGVVNLPLKIKVISNNYPGQMWYELNKNYSFRLLWDIKNGEVAEFFGKGNRALGWRGDLIVRMRIVDKIKKRLRIFSSHFEQDKTKLWFLVPQDKQDNPNKWVFDYKTHEFIV
ncbi:J domain-containing protein [Mycoplasmoides pneumoniae]